MLELIKNDASTAGLPDALVTLADKSLGLPMKEEPVMSNTKDEPKSDEVDDILDVLYMQGEYGGRGNYNSATHQIMSVKGAKAAINALVEKRVAEAEKDTLKLIDEHNSLEDRLDSLSEAVAAYFKQDIGEHSSMNDPWYNAFELLRDNTVQENLTKQKASK